MLQFDCICNVDWRSQQVFGCQFLDVAEYEYRTLQCIQRLHDLAPTELDEISPSDQLEKIPQFCGQMIAAASAANAVHW